MVRDGDLSVLAPPHNGIVTMVVTIPWLKGRTLHPLSTSGMEGLAPLRGSLFGAGSLAPT